MLNGCFRNVDRFLVITHGKYRNTLLFSIDL